MGGEFEKIITKGHVEKVVANQFELDGGITVVSYRINRLTSEVENFNSLVLAVDVEAVVGGEERNLEYVAKILPLNNAKKHMLLQMGLLDVECAFYKDVGQTMLRLRSAAAVSLGPIPIPKFYYASEHEGIIILENLKVQGFDSLEHSTAKGMETEDLEMVLTALAEFHATGYHLLQSYPGGGVEQFLLDNPCMKPSHMFELSCRTDAPEAFDSIITNSICSSATLLRNVANLPELANKLRAFAPIWKDKVMECCRPDANGFVTLIHGDAWHNNFMFRQQRGGDKELKMLDFQNVNVNAPSFDLAYLLHASTFPATRRVHGRCWLRLYHATLIHNLAALGHEERVYPFEELERTYAQLRLYGMLTEIMNLSMMLVNPEIAEDLDSGDSNRLEERFKKIDESMAVLVQKVPFFVERFVDVAKAAEAEGLI